MSNDDLPTHIQFSNNRTEGHGRQVTEKHVTNLISEFREQRDPQVPGPIDAKIIKFIQGYETENGLRRYAPLTNDEITALVHEYEATKTDG